MGGSKMKVYVVIDMMTYEADLAVEGVFSTEEKARAFVFEDLQSDLDESHGIKEEVVQ
jgi:hypothetical protein